VRFGSVWRSFKGSFAAAAYANASASVLQVRLLSVRVRQVFTRCAGFGKALRCVLREQKQFCGEAQRQAAVRRVAA
jgi:hypothetical protein